MNIFFIFQKLLIQIFQPFKLLLSNTKETHINIFIILYNSCYIILLIFKYELIAMFDFSQHIPLTMFSKFLIVITWSDQPMTHQMTYQNSLLYHLSFHVPSQMKMRGMWTIWELMTMIQSVDSWKLLTRTYHNFCLHLNDKCLFL